MSAPQVPVWQTTAGQLPQSTDWPQLFVSVPHLPAQVVARDSGVQHAPPALQTCPAAQHAPVQQTWFAPQVVPFVTSA